MKKKLINIFTNGSQFSLETQADLTKKLVDRGYTVTREYSQDAELIICIGGDGSLLETVHSCNFPECPIIGINTGHLGFFQELSPDDLDHFISDYENGQYTIQHLSTVAAEVTTKDGRTNRHIGLNEIVIKGRQSYAVHLHICIDGVSIEKFSGDGILGRHFSRQYSLQLFTGRLYCRSTAQTFAGDAHRPDEYDGISLVYLQHPAAFGSDHRHRTGRRRKQDLYHERRDRNRVFSG